MQTKTRILRKSITRDEFKERMFLKSNSIGSKSVLECSLTNFDEFCKKEYDTTADDIINKLRDNQGDELYHFLQDFINYMVKKNLSASSVRTYFSFIRTFLRSQGIKIHSEDIKDLIRFPTRIKDLLEPLTKEQIRILLDYSKPDRKALYLTLLSSGMRIGEALALRKKDFVLSTDPVKIRIPGIYTKTKQTRETFISSEAKDLVLRLVEAKNDDDLVFGKTEHHSVALNIEEKTFAHLRERCGLTQKYKEGGRYKVNIHSMRAFFHTQASITHDEQYANAMDGHQGYLLQYYRLTKEKRAELYLKLEPYLLVYGNEQLVQDHEQLREQLWKKSKEIDLLKENDLITNDAIANLSDQLMKLVAEVNDLK